MEKSIIAISIFLLTGCGDEVSLVKDSLINNNQPYRYKSVLDDRPVCEKIEWLAYTERDHKYVKYSCLLKKGKTSLVYSASDEELIRKQTLAEFIEKEAANHQKRLENLQSEIAKGKALVENFDSLTGVEKRDVIDWSIGDLKMKDIITEYADTPDGSILYATLWEASKGSARRQHPIDGYVFAATSERPEVKKLLKEITFEIVGRYLNEIDKLIKKDSERYGAKKETNILAENYANSQVDLYRNIYPLSRTETVVWTWSKLDSRYVIAEQYTDHKWFDEKEDHQRFCLDKVVYAATHNVDDIDAYLKLIKGDLITDDYCRF